MKRRSFLKAPLAAVAALEAFGHPSEDGWTEGPSKPDFRHVLHFEHSHRGQILIKSDASPTPRHLIQPEVIDGIWGPGAYSLTPGRVVLDLVRTDLEPDLHLGFLLEIPVMLPVTRGLSP